MGGGQIGIIPNRNAGQMLYNNRGAFQGTTAQVAVARHTQPCIPSTMAAESMPPQEQKPVTAATLSLIRKLTTEKAVKAHRQQTKEKAATADEITNIKLSSRGIKTIESFDLPSLRRLDLSKNNLNRLKGLQSCPEVTYLTAAGNELTGEGLDGVRPLRDLKVFNASGNRVRRIPPTVFAQFRQLQALVLNNNEISEVPPTWFKKGLLTLNTLVLSHNKVKSLSDTGLGRLTALTKLSVSHNELCELPDLSACSGLEELRAAHNLISEVPVSLGKNVALRTLDLGHNTIEGWGGLERVGKSLSSLVQITLAGNPLCGNAPSGTEASDPNGEGGGGQEAAAREGEGDYVSKVRSLFPSLKVRDGKRILMKKSHTYYEQRAAEADANASGGFPSSSEAGRKLGGGRPGKGSGDRFGGDAPKVDGQKNPRRLKGAPADAAQGGAGGDDAVAGRGKKVDGNARTSSGESEKEKRREARRALKKEAARTAAATAAAAAGEPESARIGGGAGARDLPGSAASDKRNRLPKDGEDPAGLSSKKKKRRREAKGDSPEAIAATSASPEGKSPIRDPETEVVEDKKQRTKKKSKVKASAKVPTGKVPTGEGKRAKNEDSRGGGGGGGDGGDKRDPYSSSEELPVPGKRAGKKRAGDVKGGAKSAAQEGDRESGVVSVVLNRKRKGAGAGESKGKAGQAAGGGGLQRGDADNRGGGEGGFSVEGMLAARGQRETVGLGSGVSAWG